jgi:hypothetical protein
MTLNENYYYKVEGNITIWPGIKLTINDKQIIMKLEEYLF